MTLTRKWMIHRCIECKNGGLSLSETGTVARCSECGQAFPYRDEVLDTLVHPSEDVICELQGMASELGWSPDRWEEVKLDRPPELPNMAERLTFSRQESNQYYQQTTENFEQALSFLPAIDQLRVLEIGSEYDYDFLKKFRESGGECFAVNIFFSSQRDELLPDWPEKTLADMINLPFFDEVFDLILLSATSHHSPTLEKVVSEVARVLRPGGYALFLSDPLSGWLKGLGGSLELGRNSSINECRYPFRQYNRLFELYRFSPTYLFSAYYDRILASGEIHPTRRFARLGRVVSWFWRVRFIRAFATRRLLRLAHVLFGFPLNAVLKKGSSPEFVGR